MRVLAGATWYGPHDATIPSNRSYSARARGPMRCFQSSRVASPHECHTFFVTNFAPHRGQVHSGPVERAPIARQPVAASSSSSAAAACVPFT